jgi:hypothetical protein
MFLGAIIFNLNLVVDASSLIDCFLCSLIKHYQIFKLTMMKLEWQQDYAVEEDSIILGDLWAMLVFKN